MGYKEQLNKVLEEMKTLPLEDRKGWREKARSTCHILTGLTKEGGAGECDLEDLMIAARINMERNAMYDSIEEWMKKREDLIREMKEAIHQKRDSIIWLRMLIRNLTYAEMRETVDGLRLRQINQFLFPALEEEAKREPTENLMKWYIAMLDRSDSFESEAFNRLAYFYLWNGHWECDEEKAKNYFLAMERRGIARKNPYKGSFGESGHEEMIQKLLKGELEKNRIGILAGYAEKLVDEFDSIDDCREEDLRQTMERLYKNFIENPTEENAARADEVFKTYGAALQILIKTARENPDREHLGKAIVFLFYMLYDHDNWLLRIIELEAGGRETEAYYARMQRWLEDIEEFCGGDFIIGEELLVMNSLYENLIAHWDAADDRDKVRSLLEKHVYSTDGLAVLSKASSEIRMDFLGSPYMTHNGMALLKMYKDDGADEKAEELVKDIGGTEKRFSEQDIEVLDSSQLNRLKNKYLFLLKKLGMHNDEETAKDADLCREYYFDGEYAKATEACDPKNEKRLRLLEYIAFGKLPEGVQVTKAQEDPGHRGGTARQMSFTGGFMTATEMTCREQKEFAFELEDMEERFHEDTTGEEKKARPKEDYCLKYTFRPAPATVRGDFIRYLYSNPGGRDWFGRTEEEWEEAFSNLEQASSKSSQNQIKSQWL